MINIKIILIILNGMLLAGTPIHTKMDQRIIGKSFNGNLSDSNAYRDGLGVIALQHHSGTKQINDELKVQNKLGELIDSSDITNDVDENVLSELIDGNIGSQDEQDEIKSILPNLGIYLDGTPCEEDGDTKTIEEYQNHVCTIIGCDDNNVYTIDSLNNGVCEFIETVEGESCDDGDENTNLDSIENGVCTGYVEPSIISINTSNTGSFFKYDVQGRRFSSSGVSAYKIDVDYNISNYTEYKKNSKITV